MYDDVPLDDVSSCVAARDTWQHVMCTRHCLLLTEDQCMAWEGIDDNSAVRPLDTCEGLGAIRFARAIDSAI